MSRYIDADAIQIPKTHVDAFENCRNCELLDADQVREIINSAPSIDIEAKRGKWVRVGNVAHTEHKCSVCGKNPTRIVVDTKLVDNYFCSMAEPITEYIFGELLSDFCPNCGADMREREGE